MDLPTIGGTAGVAVGTAGMTSWLFWKLLLKSIDNKVDKCVCEEKHKVINDIKTDIKETRKDVGEIKRAIVRLETKGER